MKHLRSRGVARYRGAALQGLSFGIALGLAAAVATVPVSASPLAQVPPTAISVTIDRGANATYAIGETIVICVQAQTAPAVPDYAPSVRITDLQVGQPPVVLYEGQVQGQRCMEGFVTPPAGGETIRAEYLVVGITGQPQVINTAQVSFQVAPPRQPVPPLPPTPTPLPSPPTVMPAPSVTGMPLASPTATSPAPSATQPTPTTIPSPPGAFSVALIEIGCAADGSALVTLAWSRSQNFDFYHVYRDGQEIWSEGPKSSFAYVDSRAPAGAEVGYELVATNPFGTQPGDPAILWVQTASCDEPSVEPPQSNI